MVATFNLCEFFFLVKRKRTKRTTKKNEILFILKFHGRISRFFFSSFCFNILLFEYFFKKEKEKTTYVMMFVGAGFLCSFNLIRLRIIFRYE